MTGINSSIAVVSDASWNGMKNSPSIQGGQHAWAAKMNLNSELDRIFV